MQSLQRTNGAIGGGSLRVAPDVELLDPCREVPPPGVKCGSSYCDAALGEVYTICSGISEKFHQMYKS